MIIVEQLAGLCTVQDLGRPGRLHQGLPVGGAMAPARLRAANAAVGNPPGAAGLELAGALRLGLAGLARPVSVDGGQPVRLEPGQTIDLATRGARALHLAVGGGIAVPLVLGSRSTLLVARLGGHQGRALIAGDRLPLGAVWHASRTVPALPAEDAAIRVIPGPDLERFPAGALAALLVAELVLSATGDRIGVRMTAREPGAWRPLEVTAPSAPMVRGAIQVTPAGECIVLGPEHPLSGGYPLIATVHSEDVGMLLARAPGRRVRLVTAS
jgi:allophanate hydrolase subunit 2